MARDATNCLPADLSSYLSAAKAWTDLGSHNIVADHVLGVADPAAAAAAAAAAGHVQIAPLPSAPAVALVPAAALAIVPGGAAGPAG